MTRRKKFLKTPAERQRLCRGNTTSGADRRGNKAGRPSPYPPDTVLWSWTLKMSDAHCRKAKAVGNGNIAAGIRKALDNIAAPARYAEAPEGFMALTNWMAVQKASGGIFSQEKLDYEDEQQEKALREEEARLALEPEPPEAPESLSELLMDDKDDEDEDPQLPPDLPGYDDDEDETPAPSPVVPFDMFAEIENAPVPPRPAPTEEEEYG